VVAKEGTRDTMSLDAHDLLPNLEELEAVSSPSSIFPHAYSHLCLSPARGITVETEEVQQEVEEDGEAQEKACKVKKQRPDTSDDGCQVSVKGAGAAVPKHEQTEMRNNLKAEARFLRHVRYWGMRDSVSTGVAW
jgi:hypothetical protein